MQLPTWWNKEKLKKQIEKDPRQAAYILYWIWWNILTQAQDELMFVKFKVDEWGRQRRLEAMKHKHHISKPIKRLMKKWTRQNNT